MNPRHLLSLRIRILAALLVFPLLGLTTARADDPKPKTDPVPAVLDKLVPENIDDLKAMQQQVR